MSGTTEKVSIIISKGSLESIYPGLDLATITGGLPGMPGLLTAYMERKMGKLVRSGSR